MLELFDEVQPGGGEAEAYGILPPELCVMEAPAFRSPFMVSFSSVMMGDWG